MQHPPALQRLLAEANSASQPAPSPAPRPPASPLVTPVPTVQPRTGNTGGTPPPPVSGGGGGNGGGFAGWQKRNPFGVILIGVLLIALLYISLNYAMSQITKRDIETLREYEAAKALAAKRSSAVPDVQSVRASNKQSMIANCGRRTEAMMYKLYLGCFYFDNGESSSPKDVVLLVSDPLRSIELDGNEEAILITSSDGTSCQVSKGDSCRYWMRDHFRKEGGGFAKFTLRVPSGGAFIANVTKEF